jgi:hypothetical protein
MSRHKHKCPRCGCIWEHDDALAVADCDVHDAAHRCPACGTWETERYDGAEPAAYHDHHLTPARSEHA